MTDQTTTEPAADPAPPPDAPRTVRGRLSRVLPVLGSLQGYIGLLLVILAGVFTKGLYFWNQTNITDAISAFSTRGILAVGVTLVILTAGIDLSVGSLMGLGSMVSALLFVDLGWPVWLIVPACAVVGALFGLLNGIGSTWLKIQSFVMTLAMLSIARGIDRQISNNVAVGVATTTPNGQLTPQAQSFAALGTPGHTVLFGFGYPVVALIVVVIVFQLVLSKTRFGRHIYAVGGNPTAARLSGVNVTAVVIAVFALSGLLAGFAGPIDAAYNASADPLAGTTYELDAIAAAVIGGTSLAGGRGTVIGTFVGALTLTLLDNVLGLNSVSDNLQLILKGLIVIIAVVVQRPDFVRSLGSAVGRMRGKASATAGTTNRTTTKE